MSDHEKMTHERRVAENALVHAARHLISKQPIAASFALELGDGKIVAAGTQDAILSLLDDAEAKSLALAGYKATIHTLGEALHMANARLAELTAKSAASPLAPEAREQAEEAAEILDSFIGNVEKDGNYSAEATLTFLSQAKQCVDGTVRALRTQAAGAEGAE